jgi:hypothetical protein
MPNVSIDERDLAIAREHPRGTERRTLLPYREALGDVAAYARCAVADRDVIVRWVEVRRRLADGGLDHDDANLADPLLPYARLRAHVLAGEYLAARITDAGDPGGDMQVLVALIRRGSGPGSRA